MPWRTLLRTSGAIWGLIPVCAWMWLVSHQPDFTSAPRYWEAATAKMSLVATMPLALCAAAAAWEGVRLKRSRLVGPGAAPARSTLSIALSQLHTLWGVGAACILWALVCVVRLAQGGPGGPDLRVLALMGLMVCTYTLVGYAVGWLLPAMLAVPVAAIATYLWLTYPVAVEPLWLRQLNGTNLRECCSYKQALRPAALIAPALVAAGLAAAALITLITHVWWRRLVALVPLAAALLIAIPMVKPLGYNPSQPRPTSALSCSDGTPHVCTWPEQEPDAANFRKWAGETAARLQRAGVSVPTQYMPTFANPHQAVVRSALISGILLPASNFNCPTGSWPGQAAYDPVRGWLEVTAGTTEADVAKHFDDDGKTIALIHSVRSLPARTQLAWYQTNLASLTNCTKEPRLDPATYRGSTQ